jgi:hypothetical protein
MSVVYRGQRIMGAQAFPLIRIVSRALDSVAVTVDFCCLPDLGPVPSSQVPFHVTVAPARVMLVKRQENSSLASDIAPMRVRPAIGDAQPSRVSAQSPTIERGFVPVDMGASV